MTSEPIFFPARDGILLEGQLHLPAGSPNGAGVVLAHTHPQQPGGHMHTRVLRALAQHLAQQHFVALRFNFRGVQNSAGTFDDGQAELHDVGGAVDYLRKRSDVHAVMLVGYSFGARVCLPYATTDKHVQAVVTIGFPARRFVDKHLDLPMPSLHLVGDQDTRTTPHFIAHFVAQHPTSTMQLIHGADHFFRGHEATLTRLVVTFLQIHLTHAAVATASGHSSHFSQ